MLFCLLRIIILVINKSSFLSTFLFPFLCLLIVSFVVLLAFICLLLSVAVLSLLLFLPLPILFIFILYYVFFSLY